jgi:translation initiation factor 3 subunit B
MADFSDAEFERFGEERLVVDPKLTCAVIVDNVPVIDMVKYEKLCAVMRRIFSGYGKIAEDGFYMPVQDGKTQGHCFIEFATEEGAKKAVAEGDNKKLDKEHKLRVTMWEDYNRIMEAPETYEPPERTNFDNQQVTHSSWLLDHWGRDQFIIRYGKETRVYWNDPYRKANDQGRVLQYGGEREKTNNKTWTDSYVAWSPQGSYLATFHRPGILLWGGDEFQRLGRFMHPGVNVVAFSPSEKYIITSNGQDRTGPKDQNWCIQVWDIKTQKMMRGFDKANTRSWPAFHWSFDDRFFARAGVDVISVYETPHMGLLDKKSIKVPGVQQIAWCPSKSVLAYWVPEVDNVPAKVALMEFPSRTLLREKHLYSVSNVKMHWQSAGEYLCVKMERKKTKKTAVQNFEIFRLNQKSVPVEVLEMEDQVIAFAWEPRGNHFALVHGNPARPDVSFYKLTKKTLEKVKTLENRAANCLFWSPTGDYIIIAGLGEKNGQLDFVEMSDFTTSCSTEHVMCTDVEWDPSGRFVITSVTQPIDVDSHNFRATMENGYKLWSCSGQLLQSISLDQFYQVIWRPRPKTLLSPEQLKEIKNKLKEDFWRTFEQEDEEIRQSQLSGVAKEKQQWKEQWKAFRARAEAEYAADAAHRIGLRGGLLSDDEDDYVETEIVHTEEISCETTIISK